MRVYNNIDDLKRGLHLDSSKDSQKEKGQENNKSKSENNYHNFDNSITENAENNNIDVEFANWNNADTENTNVNNFYTEKANGNNVDTENTEKNNGNIGDLNNNNIDEARSNKRVAKHPITSYSNRNLEELENYDKLKTKVLKYVVYKKRTESEIKQKFLKEIDEDTLEKIISELKENGYINDDDYINRAVNEFMALRNLSQWEIKYKLISKGIKTNKIEKYFSNNYDILNGYEKRSARNIALKKKDLDKIDIKKYLIKKGYKEESIREALESDNEWYLYIRNK